MLKKIWVILFAVVIAVSGTACTNEKSKSTAQTKEKGTDPITGETYPEQITIGTLNGAIQTAIAEEEKFFDDIGIDTKILYFDSGRDVNNAFASGSIDVATFGSSPIALGLSSSMDYEVVYINDVIGTSESLAVKKDLGITTVAELKGKKIATPFASTSHFSLLNALKLEGIDEKDVELLDMQPQDILAAWERGDIDAAYIWNPVFAELIKDGGITLTSSEELAKKGVVTADLSAADKNFAEKYPTLVSKYLEAFNKTYDLIQNNFDQAAKDVAQNLDITVEEAEEQLKGVTWISQEEQISDNYLGSGDKSGQLADTLKATADFHVEQGNLDKAPEIGVFQKAVNSQYVEKTQ